MIDDFPPRWAPCAQLLQSVVVGIDAGRWLSPALAALAVQPIAALRAD